MAKDPVCGMKVKEKDTKWRSEYKGKTYFFCAPGCKTVFDKEPEKYLKKK
jgi:YHS domain-containing protein